MRLNQTPTRLHLTEVPRLVIVLSVLMTKIVKHYKFRKYLTLLRLGVHEKYFQNIGKKSAKSERTVFQLNKLVQQFVDVVLRFINGLENWDDTALQLFHRGLQGLEIRFALLAMLDVFFKLVVDLGESPSLRAVQISLQVG